jgi:hypothetical protein
LFECSGVADVDDERGAPLGRRSVAPVELTGDNGLLTALVRQVLHGGLEVEMTDHVGYEPHATEGRGSGNSRNGTYPKSVTTEIGKVDLRVPRDRNGTFDPVMVRKGERRLDGLAGNVISLYAKGMTTGDIQAHLAEIYGTDISRDRISRITDAVVEDMVAWQNRPLDRVGTGVGASANGAARRSACAEARWDVWNSGEPAGGVIRALVDSYRPEPTALGAAPAS